MLCIWWDCKGVVYYELLPQGQAINSEKYCAQLDELKAAIIRKRQEQANRRGVVFHRDNSKTHLSLMVRNRFLRFDLDVLLHPPYSPDLALSDCYLFLSLKNPLCHKKFELVKAIKNDPDSYFASKSRKIWEGGIMRLPGR